MTTLREAAQMALEALDSKHDMTKAEWRVLQYHAFTALRAALAQPEQEPVAWISNAEEVKGQFVEGRPRRVWWECNTGVGQPLYTAPPQREWQGLTDEDIEQIHYDIKCKGMGAYSTNDIYRAIEAKLREKNT